MNDFDKHAGTPDPRRLDGTGRRFGIAVSRYNEGITRRLLEGARGCLAGHGVEATDIHVAEVPGAWEIPLALRWLAGGRELDGLIALGVVIRGETPHFDYVCTGCTDGCRTVSEDSGLPVGFGLLTCDDAAQANARAGGAVGNKGEEAALAALEMVNLRRDLDGEEES